MALHRTLAALSVIVLVLASDTGGGAAYVLCVGSDGHVKIEPESGASCCAPAGGGSGPAASAAAFLTGSARPFEGATGRCGRCLDIPLGRDRGGAGSLLPQRPCPRSQLHSPASLPPSDPPPVPVRGARDAAESLHPSPSPSIPLLATVILLV